MNLLIHSGPLRHNNAPKSKTHSTSHFKFKLGDTKCFKIANKLLKQIYKDDRLENQTFLKNIYTRQ